MRYSLSNRFRGAILGAMLGEKTSPQTDGQSAQSAQCLVPGMRSLIELGRFEQPHWQEKLLSSPLPLEEFAPPLTTLPLAFFYHENELKLRQSLIASASIWHDRIMQESILAVGYAIAQALSEIKPTQLIARILRFIETPQTELSQKLRQVDTLLSQGASLERVLTQLDAREPSLATAIALGFYCFLSSQEDFSLTVRRALRLQQPLASAIAGALSGAYHSDSNIPSSWQTALAIHQTSTEKEVLQLSDSLVAVWLGVFDYEVNPAEIVNNAVVVAAPGVIRSR